MDFDGIRIGDKIIFRRESNKSNSIFLFSS